MRAFSTFREKDRILRAQEGEARVVAFPSFHKGVNQNARGASSMLQRRAFLFFFFFFFFWNEELCKLSVNPLISVTTHFAFKMLTFLSSSFFCFFFFFLPGKMRESRSLFRQVRGDLKGHFFFEREKGGKKRWGFFFFCLRDQFARTTAHTKTCSFLFGRGKFGG